MDQTGPEIMEIRLPLPSGAGIKCVGHYAWPLFDYYYGCISIIVHVDDVWSVCTCHDIHVAVTRPPSLSFHLLFCFLLGLQVARLTLYLQSHLTPSPFFLQIGRIWCLTTS